MAMNFLIFKSTVFLLAKLKTMQKVTIILSVLLFMSCTSDNCRAPILTEKADLNIKIDRIEDELFSAQNAKQVQEVLHKEAAVRQLFLHSSQYPHDSVLATSFFTLLQQSSLDTLYNESIAKFNDISSLTEKLEQLIGGIKRVYPDAPTPKVKTIVTGLYNDLYVSDSLIVIGIDYFIGKDASFRPLDVPEYIMRRYDSEYLVPTIGKFMAGEYVNLSKSESFISDMIDYGKTHYFLGRLLPCVPEHIIMGWSEEELKNAQENQTIIWANFVENQVLYETNHLTKRMFLGERPNVYEISKKCPGRIGAWVGWKIVESYMNKNDVTIQELMKNNNNEELFRLSGYKPRNG